IVAENGVVALFISKNGLQPMCNGHEQLSKLYQQHDATRQANYARMQQIAVRVLREVPGAVLAQDSAGRETDIAIDHGEFAHLPAGRIAQAVQIMQSEGMNASVSSIHINGWLGAHNKLDGARWIVRELLGRELDAELERWVYVGDSTNDQLMFEAFPNSVGVVNIRRFEAELSHQPRYITEGGRGAGFAEVAAALLDARAT
ncbi:MAG: HAD family hydrolase, partial [Polaromonas sp.]|nr:HAD family hydrolase [Polaromonas sp.]